MPETAPAGQPRFPAGAGEGTIASTQQRRKDLLRMNDATRCSRCYARITGHGYRMAGRLFCCQSCSVGSACEHQGVRRPVTVRRFDTMFPDFRDVARPRTPYEPAPPIGGGHA